MKMRRQPRHGGHRSTRRAVFAATIVSSDLDGRNDIFHCDVFVDKVADIVAAITSTLDANARGRAFELDSLDADMLYTAGDLAADRKPMPLQKNAVTNR